MMSVDAGLLSSDSESFKWFVMAPVYNQERRIKQYLDSKNIRYYLPVKIEITHIAGRKRVEEVPAIRGLLFVYTTETELKSICEEQPYLYYKYDRVDGVSRKMVVPTKEMEDFLRVSSQDGGDLIYFDPKMIDLKLERGVAIRLHSNNPSLDGVEGIYMKVEGRRNKRLVITLNGLYAVAMVVDIDIIEKI